MRWTIIGRMEPRISIITLGVSDVVRSFHFYRDGLGFPTTSKAEDGFVIFRLAGTKLALFPLDKLAEDICPGTKPSSGFGGITIAHNVRSKEDVARLLNEAAHAGGKILKPAEDAFWGGHSGYFSDPDGYAWEVAWAPGSQFNEDGSLAI